MTHPERIFIQGTVIEGYRIASGLNTQGAVTGPNQMVVKDSFVRQRKFFEEHIPDIKKVWTGTINLDISPRRCRVRGWDYEITCEWHPGIIETFGIIKDVEVHYKNKIYTPAFIYYPLPSSIHSPRENLIELLAPKIEDLAYGDNLSIQVPAEKVGVEAA